MKIYCLKNEYITVAVQHTINYLLNRIGFFFDWITDPKQITDKGLLLVYQPSRTQAAYQVPTITLIKHFDLERLHNSNLKWDSIDIGEEKVPILIDANQKSIDKFTFQLSSYDIIANIYYHLNRLEEINFQHPDDIDENLNNSILFKHGNFMIPVVDVLCDFLKQEIEKRFQENKLFLIIKTFYPRGETYGIAITHDVDFIHAFHPIKKQLIKLFIRLKLKKDTRITEIDRLDANSWGFDRLLPFYRKNNLKATFFFMAKYIEGLHFRYWIGSKKIRQLFKQLKSEGHEIAFHPSRYTFEKPKRYFKEKKKLEKISNTQISGLRHHYLRCLFPEIWQKAAELNLKYEAGMIHRRYSGFRAGTCFPYIPFDPENQKQINIIEFPTTFFENTLPDKGAHYGVSKETIIKLLAVVKKHGGLFNILWHSNNIYQPGVYFKLWNFITSLIIEEDAYIQPLVEHYNWYNLREQIRIDTFKKSKKEYNIYIILPKEVQYFCLNVPSNYDYKSKNSLLYDPVKKSLIIENEQAQSKIVIEARAK